MEQQQDSNKLIEERREKLKALRAQGIAFPNDFRKRDSAGELHRKFDSHGKEALEKDKPHAVVAGRMMLKRVMGKASFATLQDGGGRIQAYVTQDIPGYGDAPPPAGSRATSEEMGGWMDRLLQKPLLEAVQRLKPLAAEAGLSLPQFALAWVLREPNVASAIIGASRPEQVEENAAASGAEVEAGLFAEAERIVGEAVAEAA